MCHDKLHVELGPLINFIVGLNGSGKSAVLTAITLCLGGKTSSTNRGASLKSLIKSDRDQAILIVKLKNQGNDAYQPDVFGGSIIVERHFSRSGSSGYKLKNANGRTVSTKKGDVDDIVEYFQLQVDNPMNVLTQDAAKSFITKSTPAQKYKFFVEGVQLEALDNDYKLVSETCDSIEAKLNESKEDIKALKKNAEAALAKSQMVMRHEGMRNAARGLQRQAAWSQVEEEEARLRERENLVVQAQERIEAQERTAEEKGLALERLEEIWERAKEAEERLGGELAPLQKDEEAAKNAHNAAAKAVQEHRTQQRQIIDSIKEGQKKVASFESDIQKELERMEAANGSSHARKLAEIQEAESAAADAGTAVEQNELEAPRLEERRQAAQVTARKAGEPLEAKRREVDAARQRLDSLNQNRGDVMAGFDKNMPRLLQMIRRDDGFRETPVGPIGLHIKLLKPIWSSILEKTLGNALNGFVVTSKFDQMRLSGMIRQLGMNFCPVLIGNHSPIDTTGHEPDPQFETILRVLDIDNELVKRQLIINQGIEQSILIEDREEAERVMFEGPKLRMVKQCFAINQNRRGWGHRLAHGGRHGNNRENTPVNPPAGKPRMKTDIESQISYQRETLIQLEREKVNIENELRQAQAATKRCEQAIVQHKRDHQKLKVDLQRAEEKVERLQSEQDRENVEDGRLDGLKAYLEEAKRGLLIDQESYGSSGVEKENLNRISIEKKRELDTVKERLADHEAKVRKAQHKTRNAQQARHISLQEKNVAIDLIRELRGAKEATEASRDRQIARVQNFIENATHICPRVPVDEGETAESIGIKLEKMLAQLKRYEKKQGGTDQEIHDAATEAQQKYAVAEARQKELNELLMILKQSFLKRIDMYRRFQQHISARSRINFNYLLSERAFRGKLTIDHKAKKLDVHVEPDETTKSSKGRQTKTLSGGEKSFSSICLLLALWEAMGAPLRCLDEFDVFMDDVNRDVSTKMIVRPLLSLPLERNC